MIASEWMDLIKEKAGLSTDYELSKETGVSCQQLSNYRTGRTKTLRDDVAMIFAEYLGIEPIHIMADQAAQRAPSKKVKSYWLKKAG